MSDETRERVVKTMAILRNTPVRDPGAGGLITIAVEVRDEILALLQPGERVCKICGAPPVAAFVLEDGMAPIRLCGRCRGYLHSPVPDLANRDREAMERLRKAGMPGFSWMYEYGDLVQVSDDDPDREPPTYADPADAILGREDPDHE